MADEGEREIVPLYLYLCLYPYTYEHIFELRPSKCSTYSKNLSENASVALPHTY